MDQDHFSKLENMYLSARVNREFYDSHSIQIKHQVAEITLDITEKFHHALGFMHGSVYFKLLDDAAYFAASSVVRDVFLLTSSFNIHFTRPFKKGKVKAIGYLRSQSPNVFLAESKILDEKGNELAFGSGSFMRSKIPLSEKIGYL